jgi:hypothetical protein
MKRFDENEFKQRVSSALQRVKTVLENSRNPQLPGEVPHEYVASTMLPSTLLK